MTQTQTQTEELPTLAQRIREFFCMDAGTCMREFRELIPKDRQDLRSYFAAAGMPCKAGA